ncbi:hypothetical protein GYMLUDRAFT_38300 [Collybiopsis luxurians FD-317 M1]|nr:hypothetical protein GYMLUDRAFT_38300 [Collybiopsis luxurians FD-317 M1]
MAFTFRPVTGTLTPGESFIASVIGQPPPFEVVFADEGGPNSVTATTIPQGQVTPVPGDSTMSEFALNIPALTATHVVVLYEIVGAAETTTIATIPVAVGALPPATSPPSSSNNVQTNSPTTQNTQNAGSSSSSSPSPTNSSSNGGQTTTGSSASSGSSTQSSGSSLNGSSHPADSSSNGAQNQLTTTPTSSSPSSSTQNSNSQSSLFSGSPLPTSSLNSKPNRNHTAAIVGGVIGGVIVIIILLLIYWRRRRRDNAQKNRIRNRSVSPFESTDTMRPALSTSGSRGGEKSTRGSGYQDADAGADEVESLPSSRLGFILPTKLRGNANPASTRGSGYQSADAGAEEAESRQSSRLGFILPMQTRESANPRSTRGSEYQSADADADEVESRPSSRLGFMLPRRNANPRNSRNSTNDSLTTTIFRRHQDSGVRVTVERNTDLGRIVDLPPEYSAT